MSTRLSLLPPLSVSPLFHSVFMWSAINLISLYIQLLRDRGLMSQWTCELRNPQKLLQLMCNKNNLFTFSCVLLCEIQSGQRLHWRKRYFNCAKKCIFCYFSARFDWNEIDNKTFLMSLGFGVERELARSKYWSRNIGNISSRSNELEFRSMHSRQP
jgi:hypothetical protein